MGHAVDRVLRSEQVRRAHLRAFDQVIAEMLVEPRPPYRRHAVARLKQRAHPLARPAAYKAEMPAVTARQKFDDGGGFAMPPYAQYDAFVGPFHGASLQDSAEGRSANRCHSGAQARRANPEISRFRVQC